MSRKILIFSMAYYPKFVSGAEAAVREITDRIDDIEFHLVTNRYDSLLPRQEKIGNVTVHRIGFGRPGAVIEDVARWPLKLNKMIYQFWAGFKGVQLHRRWKFDGIWAMMAHSAGVPAVVMKTFCPQVPYALTLQEGDPPEQIERTMAPVWLLFKKAFNTADVIQVISNFLGDWARRMGYGGPVELIYNGGNARDFAGDFSASELEQYRLRTGKKDGHIDLVTASRLVKKNGTDLVIRALPLLPDNVRFVIVGGGPEQERLSALAAELKVGERTIFIGQVDRSEVPYFRRIADIFVRPSRSEGLGNAILSAMAARKPVIATQAGGIAEYLFDARRDSGHETTGWAVDQESPEQIAAAVRDILADPEKVRTVTDAAFRMVNEKYNWDNIARAMRGRVFARLFKEEKI